MTINLSTSKPHLPESLSGGLGHLPAEADIQRVLSQLANEFFAALPSGDSFLNTTPPTLVNPFASVDLPNEDDLRRIPSGLTGMSGQSPEIFAREPNTSDAEAGFYFLKAVQTSSPGVLPLLHPDRPSFDPTLGSVIPNAISTARPMAAPNQMDVPGTQHGSLPPHTPGIEIGSQPFAGLITPASTYKDPGDESMRSLTGLLAGITGVSPQTYRKTDAHHYFLGETQRKIPDTSMGIKPENVEFEPVPDLGLLLTSGQGQQSSDSKSKVASRSQDDWLTKDNKAANASMTLSVSDSSPYFLDQIRPLKGASSMEDGYHGTHHASKDATDHPGFDVYAVRRDFPILEETVHGMPLIWFDNAATTQHPKQVIDRISYFYAHENSNIHRAAHELAARATDAYEQAREKVRHFLNASSTDEIVFVRGTTEAINLVAQSWGRRNIRKDDEIVISWLEHHANIVPWQQLCAETGARLQVIPVDNDGQILMDEYEKLLNPRTRLVTFTHVSNALGTVTPVREMIAIAHRHGAHVLVDGAQAVSHMPVDVQDLDADWYVFSGHKVFGPTGIGVLYGKQEILNATPPWQGGGNMIVDVTHERTLYHAAPARFEAGTGNIADAVGLGAAIDYVLRLGIENIARYEHDLVEYATAGLRTIPGIRLIGTARHKASVVSFVIPGFDNHDIGQTLNREGIAVRTGHHCAQPILRRFGVESTVRPSLAFYNTFEEIDKLIDTVHRIQGGRYSLTR